MNDDEDIDVRALIEGLRGGVPDKCDWCGKECKPDELVPKELLEAAAIDGANPRQIFRAVIFPILLPIYVILISLSIIWDFQVFTQIWIVLDNRPPSEYYTMAIYAFEKSFGLSEYGMGAAIALLMIFSLLGVTWFYIRKMVQIGDSNA